MLQESACRAIYWSSITPRKVSPPGRSKYRHPAAADESVVSRASNQKEGGDTEAAPESVASGPSLFGSYKRTAEYEPSYLQHFYINSSEHQEHRQLIDTDEFTQRRNSFSPPALTAAPSPCGTGRNHSSSVMPCPQKTRFCTTRLLLVNCPNKRIGNYKYGCFLLMMIGGKKHYSQYALSGHNPTHSKLGFSQNKMSLASCERHLLISLLPISATHPSSVLGWVLEIIVLMNETTSL